MAAKLVKYCQDCGQSMHIRKPYCPDCGVAQAQRESKGSIFRKRWLLFGALAIFAFFVVFGTYLNSEDSKQAARNATPQQVSAPQVAVTPLANSAVAEGAEPSLTATPEVQSPRPVDGPTFIVNYMPLECVTEPALNAPVKLRRRIGTVQAMDQIADVRGGTFYREIDSKCWSTITQGRGNIYHTLEEAEAYARAVRLPRVGQTLENRSFGWKIGIVRLSKVSTVRVLFETKNALGVYLTVTVETENITNVPQTLRSNNYSITDDKDRLYPVYVYEDEVGSRINPGLKARGVVYFDVPTDATNLVLKIAEAFRFDLGNVADVR